MYILAQKKKRILVKIHKLSGGAVLFRPRVISNQNLAES